MTAQNEQFRNKLKLKSIQTANEFNQKFPDFAKQLFEKGVKIPKLRDHSTKLLASGAIAGTLLLSSPDSNTLKVINPIKALTQNVSNSAQSHSVSLPKEKLLKGLGNTLPEKPQPLTPEQEKKLEGLFSEVYGVKATGTLEGEHLNTTYGYIGAEQHLRRYPGDTVSNHGEGQMLKEGMAPGLGAWGYFSPSKDKLTPELVETEKWYAVVQTLYLPDWNTRFKYLRDWYKYRKVLIVNTQNGQAVVAAIADSGPAAWTGKHFGGSPEVMDHLGGPRYKKGAVVLFFVDDPNNTVPLGPVEYNINNIPIVQI